MTDRDAMLSSLLAGWFAIWPSTARVLLTLYRSPGELAALTICRRSGVKLTALKVHITYIRTALALRTIEDAVPFADVRSPAYSLTPQARAQVLNFFRATIESLTDETMLRPVAEQKARLADA